jgi:hypothetical protein
VIEHRLELAVTEDPELRRVREHTVLAHDRRLPHLQVDVTGAETDGAKEDRV